MRTALGALMFLVLATHPAVEATAWAAAAPPVPAFPPGASFDPAIPSPETVLGIVPGSRPLGHDEILRYFQALADHSRRARVVPYARSFEGRQLVVLAVGDEALIGRLDGFRVEHARLLDPRGRTVAEDQRLAANHPAVVWAGYGIHGNELSSSDAAVLLAHWLVAGQDEAAKLLRRELLVLIDPCQNPDGRERSLAQLQTFAHATPNPDSDDLSHTGSWPGGRGNHYWFDLNRDWFALTQKESARASLLASWTPQVVIDSHEMGSDDTYLFSPPRAPFNPFRLPNEAAWRDRFASDQARALDARGWAYYTREWNEEFFPGYGSAWAAYSGAIGILYEMSGTQGTLVTQPTGVVRTFAQAVDHQLTSSVANLTTLASNRTRVLLDQIAARRAVVERGATGSLQAWVLPPGEHPDRTDLLARTLQAVGLEVLRLQSPLDVSGLNDARTGRVARRRLPAGTWMVPLDQPEGAKARALLDPHVPMPAAFLREEREYLERDKGSRIYDLTSWSLPLAYGVEALWTTSRPPGDWRAEPLPPAAEAAAVGVDQPFGFLVDGSTDRSGAFLAEALAADLAVRVAEKPFAVAGRAWPPGTLLAKREGNPGTLRETLSELARRHGVNVVATATARSTDGPDLGGNHFLPLQKPRIAVLTGSPVSSEGYGWMWFLLDQQLGQRFTALDLRLLGRADLNRFNVLLVPPVWGEGAALRGVLGERGLARLRRWVEAGGTLVGVGSSALMLADKETELTATRPRSQALDRFPPAVLGISAELADAAGPLRATGIRVPPTPVPGKEAPAKPSPAPVATPGSPYDQAPVLGPGALAFVTEDAQRTAVLPKAVELATWVKPLLTPGTEKAEGALERADARLRRFAPKGTSLRADLDPEHWLAWAVGSELDVFLDEVDDALVAEPPVQVAARFSDPDRLHLGGLLWPEAAGRLARTAYVTREAVGRGQVILFLGHPYYRAWTLSTRRVLVNALLYGPGLGTQWSTPW